MIGSRDCPSHCRWPRRPIGWRLVKYMSYRHPKHRLAGLAHLAPERDGQQEGHGQWHQPPPVRAAPAPIRVERQPRVTPVASTTVSASTASTAEARKAVRTRIISLVCIMLLSNDDRDRPTR